MKFFDTIFIKREFAFEIKVPPGIEIVHMENKVRFRGTLRNFTDLKNLKTDKFANSTNTLLKFPNT